MLEFLDEKTKNGRTYWFCRCDCGNEKWIRKDLVKSGKQKSCGCLRKSSELKPKDITNKRFGRLIARYNTGRKNDRSSYIWHCDCDCGNTVEVAAQDLPKINSCGCLKIEAVKQNIKRANEKYSKENLLENTNITLIKNNNPLKNNTSGYKGVSYDKSRKKYVAQIHFKGRYYRLGRFDEPEKASEAYQAAKKQKHGKFLEWYEEYKEQEQ